jgi:hypothetical protein
VGSTIAQTANAIVENFREDMGVRGERLYERRDGGYEVTRTFEGVSSAPIGLFVSDEYPPVQRVVDDGVVVMDLTAPGVDLISVGLSVSLRAGACEVVGSASSLRGESGGLEVGQGPWDGRLLPWSGSRPRVRRSGPVLWRGRR